MSKGWNGDNSAYGMYGAHQHMLQQQAMQMRQDIPSPMGMANYQVTEEGHSPQQLKSGGKQAMSRNEGVAERLQLNKNSGESSQDALQQHLQEQVEEFYGDEYAYGDEYQPEVEEGGAGEYQPPQNDEPAPAAPSGNEVRAK